MKNKLNLLLLASSITLASINIEAAGFKQLLISDPGSKDLNVGLWYPSEQDVPDEPNTLFGLAVALDAPIAKTNRGLILLSHGFGGWYAGHADTAAALADAGFVVAAPSHTGNTWSDMSSSIDQWMLDRPRHLSVIIDHVLNDSKLRKTVDADKIGVYGFSAGGFTALSLIGAVPDIVHAERYCEARPQEFVCAEGMLDQVLNASMADLADSSWGADTRIKAASIAAPGFGFAYTKASLAQVNAEVQLWSGQQDSSVPTEYNAAHIAEHLPVKPETHWVELANHFAFMLVACREAFKQEDPEEYEIVCGDVEGFDRRQFHEQMHEEQIRFFQSSLGIKATTMK